MRNAEAIHDLDSDLRTIFGPRMQSLAVYGAGGTLEGPVATMVVVDSLTTADLRYCSERLPLWRKCNPVRPSSVLMASLFRVGRNCIGRC